MRLPPLWDGRVTRFVTGRDVAVIMWLLLLTILMDEGRRF